jgi:glycosyltransferase involved in cell wall biosynthesis
VRVAYVIGTLDVGGTEGQLVALVTALDRRRFVPIVYCLSQTGVLAGALTDAGIPVRDFGLRRLSAWRSPLAVGRRVLRVLRAMREDRPDVVHGLLFHGYCLGAFVGRASGVPVLIASRRSLGNFKAHRAFYRLAERLANRLTDVVVANSDAVRADALRQEGLPPEKVVVIHNGLALERFDSPADPELRRALGLEGAQAIVAVVANLIRYKGHQVFLEAWGEVAARFPGAVAILVGDGPERADLEALARASGLTPSLRFLGSRHDVPGLLALADLLVHPSREEGFSNAILEAMAARRPVVATAVGGSVEAVVPGVTGLLVPPDDSHALAEAMTWMLGHPEEARAFGEAGRRRVAERFELSGMVRRYEAVYERLITRKRGSLVPEDAGVVVHPGGGGI